MTLQSSYRRKRHRVFGVSTGVEKTLTDSLPLLYGENGDYVFFVVPDLSWATDNGDYLTIDTDASGGTVVNNGDYLTVII